ncbi:hypothetical protein LMH87_002876 [Akanthomyces muscarius]|uniref:ML-like domain-containing protein n=1 Tax=Akanthomyces muscarius TaxID=2231603 RepID=A0A9W8UJW5_AKAMU|nr:hypothetical protein LMH87_002876 [Akanthomyces muscarius]KAJ4148404.1 hypothetical protein LMH87_002876 [Akanthomyces muscarius]
MARRSTQWRSWSSLFASALLATSAMAADILKTSGFSDCGSDATIKVDKINITYDNANKTVIFDVAGRSTKEQNVTAHLSVTAYGNQIYQRSFNPCDESTFIQQLCPLPVGDFAARGSQQIPEQFAKMVPAIAFQVPDIAADTKLELESADTKKKVACIESSVTNGKTVNVPAVSYVAAGIAGVAFLASGVSAAGAALSSGAGGAGTVSPSFSETVGWFQGMAMNGMLSVSYPPVYQSFTKNFAFSVGLVPWSGMLSAIDSLRASTGGNLTDDNVEYIANATAGQTGVLHFKRAVSAVAAIALRDIETSVNGTENAPAGTTAQQTVQGIEAYARKVSVPKSDVFMTALLVVAIVIASIVLGMVLLKVILEAWAIWGTFPESLKGFRKHYWGSIARTITNLILLLYGIWVLYCIFQFSRADSSWLAKTLAGVTLALFTGILAFFTWKIYSTVQKLKAAEGDAAGLYENKELWTKYSLFYDAYRKNYWWLFIPAIIYMFAKGACIAAGDGHGMQQTIAQLVIEGCMLVLLIWSRPYERRAGNILNIVIQTIRVLSVGCILIFVEELGVAQTTKTVTGVVLIVVQSALTGVLAILVAWNAINACITANPHRLRRKEMEKRNRELDTLTPLDAHNSLLIRPGSEKSFYSVSTVEMDKKDAHVPREIPNPYSSYNRQADDVERQPLAPGPYRDEPTRTLTHNEPRTYGHARQPTFPDLDNNASYRGVPQTNQGYHW